MLRTIIVALAVATATGSGISAAQVCPANIPHLTGTWDILPYQMPINPISLTLLPDGKVLIVAGSENDAHNNQAGAQSFRAAVWDPQGASASSINTSCPGL